ncbi:hypothetical protein BN1723_015426, partial [Verticillium longisporum]
MYHIIWDTHDNTTIRKRQQQPQPSGIYSAGSVWSVELRCSLVPAAKSRRPNPSTLLYTRTKRRPTADAMAPSSKTNFKTYEAQARLVRAMIAAHPEVKWNYKVIVDLFGSDMTEFALE